MIFHWRAEGDGAVLTGCEGIDGMARVPESALGRPVTGIAARAFLGQKRLTAIALPEGLASIGENAFLGCGGLQSLSLPDGVTRLGAGAFEGCTSLTELRLSRGLEAIPRRAFYLCRSLARADVPPSVRSIGESAFAGCAALEAVGLSEGLEAVGPNAFAGCAGLRAIRIPASVTRIDATSLPARLHTEGGLYLPGSGLLIRATASLRWSPPAGARILADGALAGNHDLTVVTLPDTVTAVGDRAFADCRCLHDIRLPEGLQRLGAEAFRDCAALKAVALPRLEALPDGLFLRGGLTATALPDTVRRVGRRAFMDCAKLAEARLNEGLTYLGGEAFAGCTALRGLTLPESLEALGPRCLAGCGALEELVIPGILPEGLSGALTDLRRVAIIAPAQPPEAFPPLWRRRAALGYALARGRGVAYAPEADEACVAWIRAHAAALAAEAADNPSLLRVMLDERCLSEGDARRLLERLSRDPEITVELLHYIRNAGGGETGALW